MIIQAKIFYDNCYIHIYTYEEKRYWFKKS